MKRFFDISALRETVIARLPYDDKVTRESVDLFLEVSKPEDGKTPDGPISGPSSKQTPQG